MCPALPPNLDLPAAREKVISNCLSSIWKGVWPGLWIQLPEMKLILLHRPKCKQWNKPPFLWDKVNPGQYKPINNQMLKSQEDLIIH